MKKAFAIIVVVLLSLLMKAQSTIDAVLSDIGKNNKSIQAATQHMESQKLLYKTGLTPSNPSVEYDYLIGSPSGAGNQADFTIVQSIDFPTVLFKKKELAKELAIQAEFRLQLHRKNVLLDAKLTCIELVYRNKLSLQLNRQKRSTEKLQEDFQKKLEQGEGNILDVNKARLQLFVINQQLHENNSLIAQLNNKMAVLNGGLAISFNDTVYPLLPAIPALDPLLKEYEIADPTRKMYEQEKMIGQKELELSKAMRLPKVEGGYHYQGILGQKFNGVHTGITIPLWENKNTVQQKKAELIFSELQLQDYMNKNYFEIRNLWEKYQNLQTILSQYKDVLDTYSNAPLLEKAFAAGQISSIEYFLEMSYYYEAFNEYLETEKKYYSTVAELFKYQL